MKYSLLFSAVVAIAGFSCGVQAQTLKKVADSNRITVAYRESSIPFSYLIGPTTAIGFSIDIADAIVEAVRKQTNKPTLEVAHVAITAANRVPLLVNGTYDLECGSTTNNSARGKDVAFAVNHFYTGTRLLTKKGSGIKNYADLAGKPLATTTGTTNTLVLRKYNAEKSLNFDLIMAKDHADAMLLLESDRAQAFGMDDVLLYGQAANSANPGAYEVVGDSLQVEPYSCMLRKDDPEFKALVDKTIKGLMNSGEFEKLYKKWFTSPIPPKGINLNLPMSEQLTRNLKEQSDKPTM